jgi:MYXO-CTERM domain-containing protein
LPAGTPLAPGEATAAATATQFPAPPDIEEPAGSPSTSPGQMWLPAAMLLVMALLMLRRKRE